MKTLKRLVLFAVIAVSVVFVYLSWDLEQKNPSPVPLLPIPTMSPSSPSPTPRPAESVSSSVFVPFWALGKDNLSSIPDEKIYYFGVAVDRSGQIINDAGYQTLGRLNCPETKSCILVLRMLNGEDNTAILKNPRVYPVIAANVIALADTHNFKGIALDLEDNTILSEEGTVENITKFVQSFYTSVKKDYKMLSFIIYGDAYYRKRAFDVAAIAKSADEVMVMAYDFSKGYGEPGPNFPFSRESGDYNYDFKQMTADFLRDVPAEKLTVIFGMYGYDWPLNAQGTPLKRATSMTDREIEKLRTNGHVTLTVLPESREKKIEYTDSEGKHTIWYEDTESAAVKTDYLQKEGVGSISFWAYSYY